MSLLGELRIVEALALVFEVGAGILPIRIEKQRIEPPVEIIMMSYVAARPREIVVLMPTTERHSGEMQRLHPADGPNRAKLRMASSRRS